MRVLGTSPEQFRAACERITAIAEEHLAALDTKPTFPQATGERTNAAFAVAAPEQGMGEAALHALADVVAQSRAQNGRFFGYVLGSGEPIAAAADLLASVLNQNVTAWRSGPAAVTIERTVVGWLAEAIGCAGFSGSLTGGGSSANLMGLAMAREAKAPANIHGAAPGIVYTSEEAHMSIAKAVALLGLGRENLRLIPTDGAQRMDVTELQTAIARDVAAGAKPIAIVASAGTVSTGAIDPLREIAAVARRHGLWLHVDGAYGALAAMAAPHKFESLNLADSLSLDAHKWLYQPLDCGCLLYRDPAAARKAFSYTGDYAKALSNDPVEGFAYFEETMELSRRFRALRLWLSLRYHGLAAFRESIRQDLALAQRLANGIAQQPRLEVLAPVELSAVCFRARAAAHLDADDYNRDLLDKVVRRGRVYLSNATVEGKFALRACITNHRTTEADVDAVIEEVLAAMQA